MAASRKPKELAAMPMHYLRLWPTGMRIDLARQQAEWDAAVPSAIEARRQEGPITKFMNWDVYIESWGERPEVDKDVLRAASGRQEVIEQAEQQADRARDVAIIAGMQSYEGPLNRRGKPTYAPVAAALGRIRPRLYHAGRAQRTVGKGLMVSMFSEIEIIRGHRFDSEQDVPCWCWGLCHAGQRNVWIAARCSVTGLSILTAP